MNKLIIVGGAPRSGTTLVQNILDSHSDVYGGPEFGIFRSLIEMRRSMANMRVGGRLDDFLTSERTDAALRSFFDQLISPLAAKAGAKAISEKTPGNAFVLADCLELFPDAVGVHVVRHPGAVVNSLMRVRARHVEQGKPIPERLESPQAMLRSTLDYMKAGLKAAREHPDRVHVMRYESLVADPEAEVQWMCSKLGLPFEAEMLRPELVEHPAHSIVASGTPWYTEGEFVSSIDAGKADAWRTDLPAAAQADLQLSLRDNKSDLAEFGYLS